MLFLNPSSMQNPCSSSSFCHIFSFTTITASHQYLSLHHFLPIPLSFSFPLSYDPLSPMPKEEVGLGFDDMPVPLHRHSWNLQPKRPKAQPSSLQVGPFFFFFLTKIPNKKSFPYHAWLQFRHNMWIIHKRYMGCPLLQRSSPLEM